MIVPTASFSPFGILSVGSVMRKRLLRSATDSAPRLKAIYVSTVTVLGVLALTVILVALASSRTLLGFIVRVIASSDTSSSIVPVAVAVPSVAGADGFDSVSVKVSSASFKRSLVVGTDTVPDPSPAGIISVPDVAVKSALVAVPGAVS